MKTKLTHIKLLTIIPAILLALSGCSDSKKTDPAAEASLDGYRGFKFGTPMWQLLSENKCEFSSMARESVKLRIDYENLENTVRMRDLREKAPDLSKEEFKELAVLERFEANSTVVAKKINEMTNIDFAKECYKQSDKLFELDANLPVTSHGNSMRDICTAAMSSDLITCDVKSEFNTENNDHLYFESDSKGRLATVRVSLGLSAREYKDAIEVIEKLQNKNKVKANLLTHSLPPKMGDLVQWSLVNSQILATWTALTDYAGDLVLTYQGINNHQIDNAEELYNQAQHMEGDQKLQENKDTIFQLYLLSAERGYVMAQLSVGKLYRSGEGVSNNIPAAKLWLQRAADQNIAEAQFWLAKIYENELTDHKIEALKWYRKAAEQGHGFAQNNLGSMYVNGEGTPKDLREAFKWYQKSAAQGVDAAQNNLGVIYQKGLIDSPNYAEALKWYQKAANQGYSDAQNNLGVMYADGLGIPRDIPAAISLYKKSAAQGNKLAESNLAILESQSK